jgi:glycosyltransferase involved in cell wall biosynthesis
MPLQRRLRILEIAGSGTVGTSDMGPVSTTICALANGFERLGHSVTVADTRTTAQRSMLNAGVHLVTLPLGGRPKWVAALPARMQAAYVWLIAFLAFWSLRKQLKRDVFDVVHVHDHQIACLLALFAPRRYYYTSHTSVWALTRDQGGKLSARERIGGILESFAIRRSRATIGLGDYLDRQVRGARIETIPHGIEPQKWQPLDRDESRAALGIRSDEFVAVFVGRIHLQKGVDVLVEAARLLAPTMPRLRVVVIGPLGGRYDSRGSASAYASEVMRRADGAPVQFVGFLGNESHEFRRYLAACDVAVVPSRHEPFGYEANEALAMTAQVIASRTGGLAQTITEEVGYLVPPEDVSALAHAIRTAHDEPEALLAKRAKCRVRLVTKYSREESVRRHVSLFITDTERAPVADPDWENSSCSVD